MKFSRRFFILLLLLPAIAWPGHATAQGGSVPVTIKIIPVYNAHPLTLARQLYTDSEGDSLYIDVFRFYMTDLVFINSRTGERHPCADCNHLVDAEDTATHTFRATIPGGTYDGLTFVVGVDSIANTSGANGGDLDPAKGMYWAWNSGYIMAKLEGRSKVCRTLHHAFEFHIGGYATPYNAARVVILRLPHAMEVNNGGEISINADAATWLNGFSLANKNSVMIPGKEANIIADNYAQMFSVTQSHGQ